MICELYWKYIYKNIWNFWNQEKLINIFLCINYYITEYVQKISQLESYVYKCDKKINEMAKVITKLSNFKKNVLQSFGEEDIEEYKTKYTSKNKVKFK